MQESPFGMRIFIYSNPRATQLPILSILTSLEILETIGAFVTACVECCKPLLFSFSSQFPVELKVQLAEHHCRAVVATALSMLTFSNEPASERSLFYNSLHIAANIKEISSFCLSAGVCVVHVHKAHNAPAWLLYSHKSHKIITRSCVVHVRWEKRVQLAAREWPLVCVINLLMCVSLSNF